MSWILPIIAFILLGAIIIIYFETRWRRLANGMKPDATLIEWLKAQQQENQRSTQIVSEVLQKNTSSLNQRLDQAGFYISQVAKEVGQMSEIGRSIKDLQEFLKSPKIRGNIGEEVLKDLISQMLPKNSFHLQYQFRSGEKVDAALKTEAGILSIDAKFPLDNFRQMTMAEAEKDKSRFRALFRQDVRRHIKDISQKYILPEEGTMDFALMYIPSETIFYEIINEPSLLEYARSQRVYVVSPSTLYVHLQMILLSFTGKKIASRTQEVFATLRGIQKDMDKAKENLDTLNKHLLNASHKMSDVFQDFAHIDTKISSAVQLPDKTETD